ncbi:subtilisin-like protein, partial [Glonium stellatum]
AEMLKSFPEVNVVNEGVLFTAHVTRKNTTWGLQRISQRPMVTVAGTASPTDPAYSYSYSDSKLGAGVDVYIVDTGINTAHKAFGGRASVGYSAYNSSDDGFGHGTHCAGTAASDAFGVASKANLIAVKVLGDDGSGYSADILTGLDWVVKNHNARKTEARFIGSVASMSWGYDYGRNDAVESAITALVTAGIHSVVAAGNENGDACTITPGALGGPSGPVLSVGAMNIDDYPSVFSNSGPCVDLYAPGEQVLSTWIGSTTATHVLDGTSMATPHITGLIAYFLAANPSLRSPSVMKKYLTSHALPGLLHNRTGIIAGDILTIANNG